MVSGSSSVCLEGTGFRVLCNQVFGTEAEGECGSGQLCCYRKQVVFGGGGDMSWSLNFEVLHEMAYFVVMCYGHTILSAR